MERIVREEVRSIPFFVCAYTNIYRMYFDFMCAYGMIFYMELEFGAVNV